MYQLYTSLKYLCITDDDDSLEAHQDHERDDISVSSLSMVKFEPSDPTHTSKFHHCHHHHHHYHHHRDITIAVITKANFA
jgi:hypothetical protein